MYILSTVYDSTQWQFLEYVEVLSVLIYKYITSVTVQEYQAIIHIPITVIFVPVAWSTSDSSEGIWVCHGRCDNINNGLCCNSLWQYIEIYYVHSYAASNPTVIHMSHAALRLNILKCIKHILVIHWNVSPHIHWISVLLLQRHLPTIAPLVIVSIHIQ